MPSIDNFRKNLMELYQKGIFNGSALKIIKKTHFVENTASTLSSSRSSMNNLIKDTFGRVLHKNTTSSIEGLWVYKINGNNPNVSTMTLFSNDGIRMLKKVCDKMGNVIKVIAYDEKGLNPKEVPAMTMKGFRHLVKK